MSSFLAAIMLCSHRSDPSAEGGKLAVAAVVAGGVDEGFGFGEVAAGEVVVREVEAHAGAGGDAEGFFEIVGRAACEEAEGKVVESSRAAEEVDGLVEVVRGFGGAGGVGTAERKVVEADVKEPPLLPVQGLGSPAEDFRILALIEEQVAVPIAPDRVKYRVRRLALSLDLLGFCEQGHGLGEAGGLMEGIGEGGTLAHPLERVAAAVGEIDRLPSPCYRFGYVAESEVKPAEVGVTRGCVLPVLPFHSGLGCGPQ